MGWKTKLQKAKQLHRPSLKNWECDELYQEHIFPTFVRQLPLVSSYQQYGTRVSNDVVLDETTKYQSSLCLVQNTSRTTTTTITTNTTTNNVKDNTYSNSNSSCTTTVDGVQLPSAESSSVSSSSSSNSASTLHETSSLCDTYPHTGTTTTTGSISSTASSLPVILDAKTLTTQVFHQQYERHNIPCIIQNIPAGYDNATYTGQPWKATKQWIQYVPLNEHNYHRNTPLRERMFKCGEDDNGKSIKVRLKYFLKYMYNNRDDSPLYIFDTSFENDIHAKSLLHDYIVPSYFTNDLFRYVSESRRPPYRWILIGPQRSGSCIHIDPLCTNAWNTLLHGQKRWVLFPPYVPKYIVKGKGLIGPKEDDEAIHYFMYILPRIKQRAQQVLQEQPHHTEYKNFVCYEFTQNAGETIFVPNGWWHAVLNLTHTIGVTQNYASSCNFTNLWCTVRKDRPRMAYKLLLQLQQHEPQLYQQATILNEQHQFRMKYDPIVQQEERQRRRQQQHQRRNEDDQKRKRKERHNV